MLIGRASAGRFTGNGFRTMVAALVGVVVPLVLSGCHTGTTSAPGSSTSSSVSSSSAPTPGGARQQVTLTINGLGPDFYPQGVAVDAQDNVYVTAVNQGLLKLASGASAPTRYPFTGLGFAASGGVDAAGNAYIGNTDDGQKGHIFKLTPDGSQTELPFPGLGQDPHLVVTPDGTVYVPDGGHVLKLPPGATSASELPFTGLNDARFVAVDNAGNVYVSDRGNSQVVMLAAGSTNQSVLPLSVQGGQAGIAVDGSGNVYLAGAQEVTVLAKGSQQSTQLQVTGNQNVKLYAIAVDSHGNIYMVDSGNDAVIELKT